MVRFLATCHYKPFTGGLFDAASSNVISYWQASETLSGVTNGNRRLWYVQDTLVARAQWYVMWEELSVSHFYNVVTTGNGTLKMF